MSKPRTCHELGVCNSRHCSDVSACPDYDLLACNDTACQGHAEIAAKGLCPSLLPKRRFTDRPGVAREAYPQPTFPFAPGVIQGPKWRTDVYPLEDEHAALKALHRAQIVVVLIVLALVGARWFYVTH